MADWIFYIFLVVAIALALFIAYRLFGLNKIKAWLLWAVTEAEAEFGGGTGKLKLARVYDKFVDKFPKLQVIVPFSTFSKLVDIALTEMKEMLKNDKINALVKGDENAND